MPEEVLFKSESDQSREDIASYLRSVADKLEQGDAVTLKSGSESVTMEPPSRPTFEVKAEREGPTDGPGELSIEFELEWGENGSEGDSGSSRNRNRVINYRCVWSTAAETEHGSKIQNKAILSSYSSCLTVMTGTGAERAVFSATFPSSIRSLPRLPVVPITTAWISFDSIVSSIILIGDPCSTCRTVFETPRVSASDTTSSTASVPACSLPRPEIVERTSRPSDVSSTTDST